MRGALTVLRGASAPTQSLMQIDPRGLSPFEAGLLFLSAALQVYPNLTWGDLARGKPPVMLKGWLTDLGHDVASAVRSVVGIQNDVIQGAANAIATVAPAVTAAVAGYATGGVSTAISGALSSISNGGSGTENLAPAQVQYVTAAGSQYQSLFGNMTSTEKILLFGGGGILVLFLLMQISRGKK